jgi:hypothetical protein
LHAKPKPGVVEAALGKRYMVLLDGETEAQPFSLKKVKQLGKPAKKVAPGTGETEGWITAIRDQRPPTRLTIPDANVPAIEPGTPSVIRDVDSALPSFQWYPQPKPRKPSRSAAYLQHVRQHDCCNCGAPGPSDPDHNGKHGMSQKATDYGSIPLCRFPCHRFRTDHNTLPDPALVGLDIPDREKGRTKSATELIVLRAQVQMLREWAEKQEKETP